ncbi:chromate resistance protein ChrB domain-containing protein [Roseibium sediminis]|uniref:chromate resistance protein ChrB domain-containing protein n=1 Tax=Roseibium sediminis TaxID=1775174 RepID=UPI00123D4FE4|nr:sulfurtransferase/chromate resistance protein [Roseibium sediminis]
MPSPNAITASQLNRLVGTPECPVIIDVRIDEDFEADPTYIPTAFRQSHRSIETLVPELLGRKVVLVCHGGLKLSEGAAAFLRLHGIAAEYLEGGAEGWKVSGFVRIPATSVAPGNAPGECIWVTRHRPKIDRIACPWLIRRFVDPKARFLFVSPLQVQGVADRFGAVPFDVEDVFWSHRGEACTFDTMVEEFGLKCEALERLALVVRAADTNRHDLAPQAAGLLAASVGLSRMFKDDLQQLEAGLGLYDAFYRWARDASDEGHDWPTAAKRG